MKILHRPVGALGTNCFLLIDEKTNCAALIDPGDNAAQLAELVRANAVTLTHILLTHGHYDHTTAAPALAKEFPEAKVYIHEADADGTGILSRFPILDFTVTALRSGTAEQRSMGHAVLDVDGQRVHFINTHLSLGGRENREVQFQQIAAQLPSDAPWIVTGDFNTEDFSEFAPLGGTLANCEEQKLLSYYPGGKAIDNIIFSHHWRPADAAMIESTHSDHNMIVCGAVLA